MLGHGGSHDRIQVGVRGRYGTQLIDDCLDRCPRSSFRAWCGGQEASLCDQLIAACDQPFTPRSHAAGCFGQPHCFECSDVATLERHYVIDGRDAGNDLVVLAEQGSYARCDAAEHSMSGVDVVQPNQRIGDRCERFKAGQGRKLRFNLRRQLTAAAFDPRQLLSRCKFVCNVAEQSVARRKSRAVGKQCARAVQIIGIDCCFRRGRKGAGETWIHQQRMTRLHQPDALDHPLNPAVFPAAQ